MRVLLVALAGFSAGLLAGFGLFAQPDRPGRTARQLDSPPEATTEHAAAAPAAGRTPPEQRRPETPEPKPRIDRRMTDHLMRELSESRDRIRDLERELEIARKTLPPPEVVRELERASVDELVGLVGAVKRVATARLLSVPEEIRARYANLEDEETAGFARLLPRGKYDEVVEKRGGGAYFSFATRENDYNKEPDVELQHGYYSTSFYGGTFGFLIDVGELPLDSVPRGAATVPASIDPEAWRFLWEAMGPDRRKQEKHGKDLGLTGRVKAVPNHTYVLRAVLPREHDILVAFRAVHHDDHGHTLIFRELKRW